MAEARCEQQRFAEAANLAQASVTVKHDVTRGYLTLGRALYERNEVEKRQRQLDVPAGQVPPPLTGKLRLRQEEAIAACGAATKLGSKDAANHYRHGRMLRSIPGRLQEAIEQYNGCLRSDERYPGARESQEEAVGKMRSIQSGKRSQMEVVGSLAAGLVSLATLTFFFTT